MIMGVELERDGISENDVAIVGMAAQLPGAADIDAFWANLRDGISAIKKQSEQDLEDLGEPKTKLHDKNYVPFAAPLDGFDMFDAEFFGFSPKEAAIMDPQHRKFLEVAWQALENAGHPPENFKGPIGAFAGCGMGSYFYFNICSNPDLVDDVGMFLLRHTGNDKDFLTTRLSNILDLTGPSVNVQTACSTSLVAAHYAVQSLLSGECDMALAGGVTIELPQGRGYIFKDGEVLSPDGQCHAFDHRAQGTVFGSGAGVVVLRRLADAVRDGDHIWGVLKGSAINNDGAAKAGYLAPSVDRQAAAVAEAQAISGITADQISYVECHGTGTYLGDPIEVAALTSAFQQSSAETGYCKIGSVKTNIGHLDTAAGVAGLIKTTLALHNKEIPASLGFEKPNPAIDFENSPFLVADNFMPWKTAKGPRRAGVNSLGVGGTNAHVVLEEAAPRASSDPSDWPYHLLTLSGRSKDALNDNAQALAQHLRGHPEQPLADIAFTLKEGRRAFDKRRVVVAETHEEASAILAGDAEGLIYDQSPAKSDPGVVFMFPGGGAQSVNMARDLYDVEPVFQEWMDRGLELLSKRIDYDIRAIWMPVKGAEDAAATKLTQPSVQLPLIMIVEYALAKLWMSWGVAPKALIGHSMGENTAACLAGVMSFEDCIGLVLLRGQLFDEVPKGGMLSVPLSVRDLTPYLGEKLDLAGLNARDLTVVSGPQDALDELEQTLSQKEISCQRIQIDIAAHSRMLDPILERFRGYLQSINLKAAKIPFISNRTGNWITEIEATDPEYWVKHLRGSVRFADGIETLGQANAEQIFLEVGPGRALSSLTRMSPEVTGAHVLSALKHPDDPVADDKFFLGVLGRLWALGVEVDWAQIWGEARRHRVPLPSYSFQRSRYFIEPSDLKGGAVEVALEKIPDINDWGFKPSWSKRYAACEIDVNDALSEAPVQNWLFLSDAFGLASKIATRLREAGHSVVEVFTSDGYSRRDDGCYALSPEQGRSGYDSLIKDLVLEGKTPSRIVSFWLADQTPFSRAGNSLFHRNVEQGFYSLMFLAQAMSDENIAMPVHVTALTTGAVAFKDEGIECPEMATILGPIRVLPKEISGLTAALLDIVPKTIPEKGRFWNKPLQEDTTELELQVLEELLAEPRNYVAAIRDGNRFEVGVKPVDLRATCEFEAPKMRQQGLYLITGGFGGIGLTVAQDLIKKHQARIVLLSRHDLPKPANRAAYLRSHHPSDKTAQYIRALEQLESLGGEVHVVAADVCNIEEMTRVLMQIQSAHGQINGVIHAAGVIDDGPVQMKTNTSVEEVFAPKIHGTQVLDSLFPDGALDWLVLFSSTSSETGPAGQVDYVAANTYLNAYAQSRRGDETHVMSLNWGIWQDVGMAAAAYDEVCQPDLSPVFDHKTEEPMLGKSGLDQHGNRVFQTMVSPRKNWVLDEHRMITGASVMPGTAYLELIAEALKANGESGGFTVSDLVFMRPFQVPETGEVEMRVGLKRETAGYNFALLSGVQADRRYGFQRHAEARLVPGTPKKIKPLNLEKISLRCGDLVKAKKGAKLRSSQEDHLAFGPRWQVLDKTAMGDGEGLASLSLPLKLRRDIKAGYLLHPGLLDIATGWAMELIEGYDQRHLWVPLSYRKVEVHQTLPSQIFSWVRHKNGEEISEGEAEFDVTITDKTGQICISIEGFSLRRLEAENTLSGAPALNSADLEFDDAPNNAIRATGKPAERLRHNLSQGILAAEGGEAFARALNSGQKQLIMSSLDIDGLATQATLNVISDASQSQSFERPALETELCLPETDIERNLASFWQDLLGVDEIGVDDSFFDLGGHSLIAVRLFTMIKKAYQIEFPISVLFEAPTIRKCANLIAAKTGADVSENGAKKDPLTVIDGAQAEPRFKHLVAMHEGEGGANTPFFLVAGMFGNVLNLRHLAHLVGTDRRIYGLQARGLLGDEEPHQTLIDAAADYIVEMRAVQPEGPYMLGGFSGGGVTAYEMARQLELVGESVSILVLLDTRQPDIRPLTLLDRIWIQAVELRQKGILYPFKWASRRLRWELTKRRNPAASMQIQQDSTGFLNVEIGIAFLEAFGAYEISGWDGHAVLFRPPLHGHWHVSNGQMVNSERVYLSDDNDWRQWIPDLDVFEVPGDHDSMVLEPNVRVLAARMRQAIAQVEKNSAVRNSKDLTSFGKAAE